MSECLEVLKEYCRKLFTGKLIIHIHRGVIKKISEEKIVKSL